MKVRFLPFSQWTAKGKLRLSFDRIMQGFDEPVGNLPKVARNLLAISPADGGVKDAKLLGFQVAGKSSISP
jgi:hypothetical protein